MISYLTIRGWEPDYDFTNWTKKDFERKIWDDFYGEEKTTDKFSLEDAYWAEKSKEE